MLRICSKVTKLFEQQCFISSDLPISKGEILNCEIFKKIHKKGLT